MRVKKEHSFNKKLFSERLKHFREKELKLIQEDVANEISRTRTAYNAIEQGKVTPNIHVIIDIYSFLKKKGIRLSLEYLCGLSDNQSDIDTLKELQKKYDALKKELEREIEMSNLRKELLTKKQPRSF